MKGDCSERLVFTAFTGWQSGLTAISWIPPVNFFKNMRIRDLKSKLRAQSSRGLNGHLSTPYYSNLLQNQ